MLFNSYVFVAAFLPLTLGGFAIACRFGRLPAALFLLFASLVFYGWWNPRYLPLLAASVAANYAASMLIMRWSARPRWQGAILAAAVAGNLAALFWCKYLAAMLWFLRVHGIADVALADPVLPLGISFFTFTQIGFLADCRQGQAREPFAAELRAVRQLLPASDRRADPAPPRDHAAIRRCRDVAAARRKPGGRQCDLSHRPAEEDAAGGSAGADRLGWLRRTRRR